MDKKYSYMSSGASVLEKNRVVYVRIDRESKRQCSLIGASAISREGS